MRWLIRLVVMLVGLSSVLALASAYVYVEATADPDLGPSPRGPLHGGSEAELAGYAVTQLAPLLVPGHAHVTVSLSEQDLGVELRAHAASAGQFSDPQARFRDGRLVVSGRTGFGPVGVVGVGRLQLALATAPDGYPDLTAAVQEIDAGRLTLPGLVRDAISERVDALARLQSLLAADPRLFALRVDLECVAVRADSVALGFHAPGVAADPAACG